MPRQLSEPNARALLSWAQQERLHRSTMITTVMGFIVIINVAMWSYFLPQYIAYGGGSPTYILIPSFVSAITLAGWRHYTHLLDNQIARLYSELVYYQARLSIPPNFGIGGYLVNNVKHLEGIIDGGLSATNKSKAIEILVKSKRIGRRGQSLIDSFTSIFIAVTLIISLISLCRVASTIEEQFVPLYIVLLSGIVVGLALAIAPLACYHRNPSEKDVNKALEELK